MGTAQLKKLRIRLGNVPVDELLSMLTDRDLHPDIRECINDMLRELVDE